MTVRICTVALFFAATVLASSSPIPGDLPAVALGQSIVYRLELLLALVYGGLLLLTPLFHGIGGRLPIEISHRGAKWPADAEEAVRYAEGEIARLEEERDRLQSKPSTDGTLQ